MKKLSLLIITALLINFIIPISLADDKAQPIISVNYSDEVQVMQTGEKGVLKVEFKNDSGYNALDVYVKISGDHPFREDVNTLIRHVNVINPFKTEKIEFNVEISPTAKAKLYDFNIVFEYKNRWGTTYTETRRMYVNVKSNHREPVLGIFTAETSTDAVKPGVEDAISLRFINTGSMSAKDINVKISGFGIDNLMLNKDVDTKKINEIKANETKFLYYNVKTAPKAKTGVYPFKLELSYIDEFGGSYKKDLEIYIHVEGNDTAGGNVKITNLRYPSNIIPNQEFEVTCDVINDGKVSLDTVEVGFDYPGDFAATSNSKKVFKNVKQGDTNTVTFRLMAKSGTNADSYSGYINVKYIASGDSADNAQTVQEYVGLVVGGDAASGKPKLIIENYDFGGEHVLAGEPYKLSLFIKNTSSTSDTRNIKVTLTSEESVFTPVDSSSSFFIPQIRAGEVYEHVIDLKTKIDASVKIYALTVKMEYEDGKGNAYDAQKNPFQESEALSIAVAQPVRLETANVIVPFEAYVGQPFYVEQEFYNMGKATMYNMMVKLEGVETNEGTYFVGNFEAGRSEYFNAQVIPFEEGSFEGKLVYTFEDALGNVSVQEIPFSYNVVGMPNFGMEDINVGIPDGSVDTNQGGFSVKKLIAPVLVLLIAAVAVVIYKKRKKKKLQLEMEELDE